MLRCLSSRAQVAFTHLRVGFDNLNYMKTYVEAGNCECCHTREDSKDYLLQCSKYIILLLYYLFRLVVKNIHSN